MSRFIEELRDLLKPGYSLDEETSAGSATLMYRGEVVRTEAGQPVRVYLKEGHHHNRRATSNLRKVGALLEQHRRTSERQKPVHQAPPVKSPINMATEILRDPQATPRERKMAKEYLDVRKDFLRVIQLANKYRKDLEEMRGE